MHCSRKEAKISNEPHKNAGNRCVVIKLDIIGMNAVLLSVIERPTMFQVKLNSSPPGQNGHHFADDRFRCISLNEKFCVLIEISLKFVPKRPIDNIEALI